MMNWIRKTSKILASLVVVVSLTIAFDYSPISGVSPGISRTELVASKEDVINNVVRFDTAQQLLLLENFANKDISKFGGYSRIQKVDSTNLLGFKIQNHTSLEFKSLLLNIVLNDIVQQKSHWV